jgi:DNA-binding transcriptional MerR regulator
MQSTTQVTIGELATRTGVARSALRYWEELGLLAAQARVSGQRRYPATAVGLVAEILLLQDAGFTLREVEAVLAARSDRSRDWRELGRRKLAELDERIAAPRRPAPRSPTPSPAGTTTSAAAPPSPRSSPPASPDHPSTRPTPTDVGGTGPGRGTRRGWSWW